MEDFVKEMIDTKETSINGLVDMMLKTVKAKYLYGKGGWELCKKELGKNEVDFFNPNFGVTELQIYAWARKTNYKLHFNVKDNMSKIEKMVNDKLGVKAIEYRIDKLNHYFKIVL